jgi:hypothetical protein
LVELAFAASRNSKVCQCFRRAEPATDAKDTIRQSNKAVAHIGVRAFATAKTLTHYTLLIIFIKSLIRYHKKPYLLSSPSAL